MAKDKADKGDNKAKLPGKAKKAVTPKAAPSAAARSVSKKATKPASQPSTLPPVGSKAPDFSLPLDDGSTLKKSALAGKKAVLYFYPKDNTPGCTTEALAFTALKAKFAAAGARVIGISKDSIEAHCKFRDKHGLGISLGSDVDGTMLEAYGVWGEKSLYGRKFMGITRSTFLLDEKGIIRKVWPKVKVQGHAEDVLEAVKALS